MTVLNAEKLQRLMGLPLNEVATKAAAEKPPEATEPVSLRELFDRAQKLFTPEEAEDLARRIEEGRAQRHD